MTQPEKDIVEALRERYAYEQVHNPPADKLIRGAYQEIKRLRAIIASQDMWVPKPYSGGSVTSSGSTVRTSSTLKVQLRP